MRLAIVLTAATTTTPSPTRTPTTTPRDLFRPCMVTRRDPATERVLRLTSRALCPLPRCKPAPEIQNHHASSRRAKASSPSDRKETTLSDSNLLLPRFVSVRREIRTNKSLFLEGCNSAFTDRLISVDFTHTLRKESERQ